MLCVNKQPLLCPCPSPFHTSQGIHKAAILPLLIYAQWCKDKALSTPGLICMWRLGIPAWYGLAGPAEHESWGKSGQEGKPEQPEVFLWWEPNSRLFAKAALLMSGCPMLIPLPGRRVCLKLYINFLWRMRSTRAAGSTMTWCFTITSTFLPMCPSETGKCNSFADEELVPGGHLALQRWQETKPSLPRLKFAP